jgi:Xaa-Pro aminopeptidase
MDVYQRRRQRFLKALGDGVAVLASAPPQVHHSDVEFPFRQDSDFYYLTGFDEPGAVAVFAPHHPEHQFVLFVRPRIREQEIWHGLRAGVEGATERFGADIAYSVEEVDQHLPDYLKESSRIYTKLGRDEAFNQRMLKWLDHFQRNRVRTGKGPIGMDDPGMIIHNLRLYKDPEELTLIERAIAISAEAHHQARVLAKPGVYEYEIQALMEYIFRKNGAQGPAYPSIVAAGDNACILHYIENKKKLEAGELLLIDAGCSYGYYNADITRTFPVSGRFSPEQKALYEVVLDAQKAAIQEVQVGRPYESAHLKAVRVLTEGMVDLGLLTGSVDQLIEEGKYREFYMHRTGHWLGLDVHDVGAYKISEQEWHKLAPGNLLTVEPGLYIAPDCETVPEGFRGIGIRIEDDVLVTKKGPKVLTHAIPKEIKDLED